MTDEEIVRFIAEKVMGWIMGEEIGVTHAEGMMWHYKDGRMAINPFDPLTNLNHTFMVVKKMREDGWHGKISWTPEGEPPDLTYYCCFEHLRYVPIKSFDHYDKNLGTAISIATLKAKGVEV